MSLIGYRTFTGKLSLRGCQQPPDKIIGGYNFEYIKGVAGATENAPPVLPDFYARVVDVDMALRHKRSHLAFMDRCAQSPQEREKLKRICEDSPKGIFEIALEDGWAVLTKRGLRAKHSEEALSYSTGACLVEGARIFANNKDPLINHGDPFMRVHLPTDRKSWYNFEIESVSGPSEVVRAGVADITHVIAFLDWMKRRSGRKSLRLPTEAEMQHILVHNFKLPQVDGRHQPLGKRGVGYLVQDPNGFARVFGDGGPYWRVYSVLVYTKQQPKRPPV